MISLGQALIGGIIGSAFVGFGRAVEYGMLSNLQAGSVRSILSSALSYGVMPAAGFTAGALASGLARY